jgi:hypothetical protein
LLNRLRQETLRITEREAFSDRRRGARDGDHTGAADQALGALVTWKG